MFTACNKQEEAKQEIVRPAKIFTIGDATDKLIRSFPGEVEASDKAIQSFRVSGELIELPAKPGQQVKKGDVIAKLDPKDYQLKYNDSKAKYDLANVQFKRAEEIWEKRLIARADYDKAKTRYLAAKATLEQSSSNLEYTVLRAPFDGVISKVHVDNFANVRANDPIVNIQSLDTVDIVFQVPENIIARIRQGEGKKAVMNVKFDAHPEKAFPAQRKEFNTEADPQTQTYRVVVTIDRPTDFNVLEGMSTTVHVDLSQILMGATNKIIIPATAVFAAEDEPVNSSQRYVWIVNPDSMRVSKQPVTVGQLTEAGIEITSGVESGQKIIAAGVNFIQESQKVKPWVRERGL
jgi:RND family efflux transporter MFP subunit